MHRDRTKKKGKHFYGQFNTEENILSASVRVRGVR